MIKSVDSAIMLQRTTDYVRDTSAAIRKNELVQDHASKMNHQHNEHEMQFVAHVENIRAKSVNPDQEKKRQPYKQPKKKVKNPSSELDVGCSTEIKHIDIEI